MPRQERKSSYIPQNEKLAIPDDWDELLDGWCHMVLCVPNSVKWRILIRGAVRRLGYGRIWRRETGVITDAQYVIEQVMESIDMANNDLTRLADAVEQIRDKIPDPILLSDFVTDMQNNLAGPSPIAGVANWIDLFLRLNELYGLIPNIDIKIDPAELARLGLEGLTAYNTAKWRQDTLQVQKAQLLSQAGPNAGLIIDAVVAVLPVADVVDTFTDVDETVLTIVGSIVSAVTGDYETNRLAEIRDALNGGQGPDRNIADEIREKVINCSCGGVGGCDGCQPPAVGEPEEPAAPDEGDEGMGDPPPAGFATWEEFRTYKCKAANRLADDLIASVTNMSSFGGALSAIATLALAGVVSSMLTGGVLVGLLAVAFGSGIVAATVITAVISLFAAGGIGIFNYFSDTATQLSAIKTDIVCDIYGETTTTGIKNVILTRLQEALDNVNFAIGDDAIFEPKIIEMLTALLGNEVINNVLTFDEETDQYIGTVDCTTCGGSGSIMWVLGSNNLPRGTGDLTPNGLERVLSSTVDSNGLHYISFKADITENQFTYLSNCDDLPAVLKNTPDENFDVIIVSTTVTQQTDGYRCAPNVHTKMWGPAVPALNVPFNISWMHAINLAGQGPFTINIKIGPAGTL